MKPSRLLYPADRIKSAVETLAGKIYSRLEPETRATFVVLLKGGARFAFDLMKAYRGSYYYDFIGVSSYGQSRNTQGTVEFYHYGLNHELIDGRAVVLLDDICDSGNTFRSVVDQIESDFDPDRILTCSLIWRTGAGFEPDFFAFTLEGSDYLVGYGLGAGEDFRHLSNVYTLDLEEE